LEGATTLYNTYWVRFNRRAVTFDTAVENSRCLFEAARGAGVSRIVHVSIANPDKGESLAYYRGKAQVEQALAESGVDFAIVRPTVLFGHEDVLINNIAWFLRRLHVFGIPGSGQYPIQPVHVEDVARTCIDAASTPSGTIVNATGPETMEFRELVEMIRATTGARALVTKVPPRLALVGTQVIGLGVRDVVLTWEEIEGLTAGLLACEGPPSGTIRFGQWLRSSRESVGHRYASEVARHFKPEPAFVGANTTKGRELVSS
jgi:NADH dehydrogenase